MAAPSVASVYDFGDEVICDASFTDVDGVTPVDPDAVLLSVTKPDGTSFFNGAPSGHPATGSYSHTIFPTNDFGRWLYTYSATISGNSVTLETKSFVIRASANVWSYSGNPSASSRDAVRLYLGDTDASDPIFSDAEIDFFVSDNPTAVFAAQAAAEAAMSKYLRLINRTVGSLSLNMQSKYENFARLALYLQAKATSTRLGVKAGLYLSTADDNADRSAIFEVGMHDITGVAQPGNTEADA